MPTGLGYARLSAKLSNSSGQLRPQTKTPQSSGRKYYPVKKNYYSPPGTLPSKYNQIT